MLTDAAHYLPVGVKVVLLADRGFIHTELMSLVRQQLGWHYRIRLKSTAWIWRTHKGWHQLKDFHFACGEARCFQHVKLHKSQWYGPVHLVFGRNNVNGAPVVFSR